ncbi:MAG: endopeptidase La [Nitrospiraceae bacterium]|nr:endopeptidase La [Nitrospiraceae bacterium]
MTESEDRTDQNEELEEFPETMPLLALTDQVLFPLALSPLRVTGEAETKLLDDAVMGQRFIAMATVQDTSEKEHGPDNTYEIGCIGRIMQMQHTSEGSINVIVQALKRFRVAGIVSREPYLVVRVQPLEDIEEDSEQIVPLATTIKNQMARLIELSPNIPQEAVGIVQSIENGGVLADLVAGNLSISIQEKQKILATLECKQRLERLAYILAHEIELLEVSHKIQHDVKSSIDKSQREYFLREQLKAIHEELGEGAESRPELEDYREKLAALKLPAEAKKEATRELERLARMNEASAEYHVITTFLDWMTELPWNTSTVDQLDIDRAEAILNADHHGLDKVKQRILEYLAVRKLKPNAAGPILCFVGPPGVGKTSLGHSIARALGRKFVRMSLGGVRDEAEIRGHRRTYVGAMPGRIIQSIRKTQSNNPMFMLDELDKLGSDFRGDPSSALLEVLDPAQNDTFTDHYLSVPFDLSKVMFIATANVLDTIPWALRDRMEVIELPGYTLEEKLQIAKKYLVPRQLEAHGLKTKRLSFNAAAIRKIITHYTREAGVRNLEREIANVCRGCARLFVGGRRKPIKIGPGGLREHLGNERFYRDQAERTRVPGVAIGMAWTAVGGDILFVEATRMPGKGGLILTGQLGDVMKESAQAVLSYVRANAAKFGIDNSCFTDYDIHIHVPAGAVPKDGPSAGVTILTAVVSLLTGKRVKNNLSMTGEITLRGLVLPVGGVKEKVLAASRAGIKEIILPARCQNDLEDVPDTIRKRTRFHFVHRMTEVLSIALGIDVD